MSWVRTRDSHIITVDDETFISDSRCLSIISSSHHHIIIQTSVIPSFHCHQVIIIISSSDPYIIYQKSPFKLCIINDSSYRHIIITTIISESHHIIIIFHHRFVSIIQKLESLWTLQVRLCQLKESEVPIKSFMAGNGAFVVDTISKN